MNAASARYLSEVPSGNRANPASFSRRYLQMGDRGFLRPDRLRPVRQSGFGNRAGLGGDIRAQRRRHVGTFHRSRQFFNASEATSGSTCSILSHDRILAFLKAMPGRLQGQASRREFLRCSAEPRTSKGSRVKQLLCPDNAALALSSEGVALDD